MATAEKTQKNLVLKNVRLSFAHLWKKSASIDGGKEKFRASFLMDPETRDGAANIKAVKAAIDKAKRELWGAKADGIKLKDDRKGLFDGDSEGVNSGGEVYDGYEGMMFIKASADRRPKIRDRDGQTELTEDDEKIFSGCYVVAYVRCWATKDSKKGGNGVFFSLEGVQFYKGGEPFGSSGMDDEDFEKFGEAEDDEDDRPKRRSRDEDDDRPARRRRDEEEDRPTRRRRDDDDDMSI